MDKLECYLVRSFERSLHKHYNKPLQKLGLLPRPTPPFVNLPVWQHMRGIPIVFVFSTPLVWVGLKVYLIHMVFEALTLHQIDRHFRALLHIILYPVYLELLFILLVSLMPAILWAAYLGFSLPAWNRRADRLNRETALPPVVAAAVPGVWPPPPTA